MQHRTHTKMALSLELYTDSVFLVGIQLVFLGILSTDTEGKLGWYISVLKKWQEPHKKGVRASGDAAKNTAGKVFSTLAEQD